MAVDLQALASTLEASLDPKQNKQAELAIRHEETKPNFSLSLLHIVASQSFGQTARLASALYFKNFIKRRWVDEDGNHQLAQNEVNAIKSELIGLMISVPPSLQAQLGDTISIIAESDFFQRWDTLVDDLVSRLTPDNLKVNIGVLQVAHSIFKRWRPLYRSDALFTEINHVLSKFGTPFLTLLESTDSLVQQHQNDKSEIREVFESIKLMVKLLYDLSVQDIPPIFEDNLNAISTLLHKYLTYENRLLDSDDDSEAGVLEHVKAGIFELLQLWVGKYEDDFKQYVGEYVQSSWTLLTNIGQEVKFDILVSRALQFLTTVTKSTEHSKAFAEEATTSQVVERVIIPNLTLRDTDIELFEDDPIEFIRRDLEGSDSDTRRRAATDFLRSLMAKFETMVGSVTMRYVDHYLAQYQQDSQNNWKSKDLAVYLYSAIAAKGSVTASHGVTATNNFANVVDFFQKHIASDLVNAEGVSPILRVDAIKYLYIFRTQMTPAQWQEAFPLLIQQLRSSEYVTYTYAAIAVERAMALNSLSASPVVERADIENHSAQLLNSLFSLIETSTDPAKLQENEFLMRCIMRVLIVLKHSLSTHLENVLTHLIRIVEISGQNPSNPRFNYYLFEALGALIRFGATTHAAKLETDLYTPFARILSLDVQEFMPYIFQLFAALLESNPAGKLSDYYKSLIGPLLDPALWASKGNVPALVRLLSAIIARDHDSFLQNNQLETILGIFQQLVATKANGIFGFELLECIVLSFPRSSLDQYWTAILQVLLTRLQNAKTESFALRFVRFYHFVSSLEDRGFGADYFIGQTEKVQAGVFTPLYLTIILPETQKLARPIDQRYKKGWAFTCEALLKLLENPPIPAAQDDVISEQDPDDMSFGVGFTQLVTIKRPVRDVWPEIADVKQWAGEHIRASNQRSNGIISQYSSERLTPDAAAAFAMYLQN